MGEVAEMGGRLFGFFYVSICGKIEPQMPEIALLTINTNVTRWLRLILFAAGAAYLWRSGLFPRKDDPRGRFDRGVRVFGAVLLSMVVIYFLGYGLGLYGPN